MKQAFFSIVLTIISFQISAQEFMGIKVDGNKQEVINAFKVKGLSVYSNKDNTLTIKGDVGGTNMEIFCFFTPKTQKCWKFVIYLPEQTSWYSLKSQYEKYLGIFTEKYGKPDNTYSFFSSPYYDGDGYEMTAVAVDKCTYSAFWTEMYSVQISKYKQVKLGYENPVNSKLYDEEKKSIENKTF